MTKPVEKQRRISQALAKVEDNVALPTARRAVSFAAQVEGLGLGEMAFKGESVNAGTTIGHLRLVVRDLCDKLRNNVTQVVSRAQANTGSEYAVEVTPVTTRNNNMIVLAVITRVN
jgi:hypothetical protein